MTANEDQMSSLNGPQGDSEPDLVQQVCNLGIAQGKAAEAIIDDSGADSQEDTREATDEPGLNDAGATDTEDAADNDTQDQGDVTPGPAGEGPEPFDFSRATPGECRSYVWGRFAREGRELANLGLERDEMMRMARSSIKDRDERFRWVYSELDRMYPPKDSGDAETGEPVADSTIVESGVRHVHTPPPADSGQIQGLHKIPEDWPELPSNASLGAEVGWVQANRLRVVEERPGAATLVRLERAASPAPSLAALGWLETSIRSYAKYVDVAARASGTGDDEGAVMRRERMALEEVKALIDEMKDAGDIRCPECGAKV